MGWNDPSRRTRRGQDFAGAPRKEESREQMKTFLTMEINEAYEYAAGGGFALHLHRIIVDPRRAPRCFVDAVDRGEDIAHLFCKDEAALVEMAKKLGVKIVVVENRGTFRQHVDLCGGPLKKAKKLAERSAGGLFD